MAKVNQKKDIETSQEILDKIATAIKEGFVNGQYDQDGGIKTYWQIQISTWKEQGIDHLRKGQSYG